MVIQTTSQMTARDFTARQPRFSGMSHLSVPCRDLQESKLFYAEVMGGTLVHEITGFVEYRIEDMIIGLSEQPEGWTGLEDEYPHYAFYVDGTNFDLIKKRLDSYDVPNYPDRRNETALMYFRDPSGNLLELYCNSGYAAIESLPAAPRRGGPAIDFRGLNYRWNGNSTARGVAIALQPPRIIKPLRILAFVAMICGKPNGFSLTLSAAN